MVFSLTDRSRHGVSLVLITVLGSAIFTRTAFAANQGLFNPDVNCSRFIIHKDKTVPLDSPRKPDGEGIRNIIKGHSEAERLLNDYQSNLSPPRWLAYVGTLGLATIVGGVLSAPSIGHSDVSSRNIRYGFVGTGVSLILGSYIFNEIRVMDNQKKLDKAIQTYNSSVAPEQRIRMGFEVDPGGQQGQVKTEVKF